MCIINVFECVSTKKRVFKNAAKDNKADYSQLIFTVFDSQVKNLYCLQTESAWDPETCYFSPSDNPR